MNKSAWFRLRLLATLFLVAVALIISVLWAATRPGKVDAMPWQAPPAPALAGPTAPNRALLQAHLLARGNIWGPEDVAVDAQGRVYGGTQDGLIVRIEGDDRVSTWADTRGRPLGLDWDPQGNLIVADAYRGLLSIDPAGQIRVLATGANGKRFRFTDDVDVASDGLIYFTDASDKFNQSEYRLDLLEFRPHGSLLVHDPASGDTRVLLDGLYFANGVALSRNEDFVLVNETWKYRILRYWLKGDRAGQHEVFIDNLPGFPDGVSGNGRGTFWVAVPSPRKPIVDALHAYPRIKNLVARLPADLQPKAVDYGLVLALDEDGRLLASYHDPDGDHLKEITSVEEHQGRLYLGSLGNDRIGVLALETDAGAVVPDVD